MTEIDDIRKSTGKVYQILTETMERYYDKTSQIYHWRLCNELIMRKEEAYRENHLFPYLFFDAMADAVLRWHDNEFRGVNAEEIKPFFQTIWKYHRQYLGMVLTDDTVPELMKNGDAIVSKYDDEEVREIVLRIVLSIIRDLEARNPQEDQPA